MKPVVYVGDEVVPFFNLPAMTGESAHVWYICGSNGQHVLLAHNAEYNTLGFLGGSREAGEGVVEAALREIQEETAGIWPLPHVQRLMAECLAAKRFFCRVSNTRRYQFILRDTNEVSIDALNLALREALGSLTIEEKKKRGHECDRLVKVEMAELLRSGGDAIPTLWAPCKAPVAYYAANQSAFA